MGQVRGYHFDAVIGVGGIGTDPRADRIDRKINWVGINPKPTKNQVNGAPVISFEYFILLEQDGPLLHVIAPKLARRMYENGVRILITGYSEEEKAEAVSIINWARKANHKQVGITAIQPSPNVGDCSTGCGTKKSKGGCK
ncbi:hypothetical protein Undi14_00320 [Undibacterium sp. 14-3-2]|uniref:hypothetical protein n=1 Tax=Undibacterium sp. 14-3-2 TaxID=2800129 RepID=UPI001903AA28|nr:hypothetical protein [Undibacterium sp. 14-3-2]MBK1888457.1 hypothetical protein [Undibacterium sp. 14-3-2]